MSKFKSGDVVRCVRESNLISWPGVVGEEYTVQAVSSDTGAITILGCAGCNPDRFERVQLRRCSNCLHNDLDVSEEPCKTCEATPWTVENRPKWEPAENDESVDLVTLVRGTGATTCSRAHDDLATADPKTRKALPVYSGCLAYFPDALVAVAELSRIGNDQHNPGKPLHWDRSKSGDELDALTRHLLQAGTIDTDGIRHSAKVAWRALANLQKEIEKERSK